MSQEEGLLSFGGHLEVLRQMLFRILGVTFVFSCFIFCFKSKTFDILLAPSDSSFITYKSVENFINRFDPSFRFDEFDIDLIATDLSSQFVTHLSTSIYLGLLCASPLIMYELFRFISPALLENERKYSTKIVVSIYALFLMGVLMSYYVLFPISFRFLG
ncbi:MAG: twin-arginine translocase subunit TatC, partial [Muribaculum sp.]|nr:twin-arginine translocase subunit TatC [Muribaculum sp.]